MNETQGSESIPTFFLQRNAGKHYQIDYAFVSEDLIGECGLEIGRANDWLAISDHMPIEVLVSCNSGFKTNMPLC
jgi:endonuclease/exonuclease/phosphatase family metal-dependent hydrolase